MQHYPFKWESGLSEEYKLGESGPWRHELANKIGSTYATLSL